MCSSKRRRHPASPRCRCANESQCGLARSRRSRRLDAGVVMQEAGMSLRSDRSRAPERNYAPAPMLCQAEPHNILWPRFRALARCAKKARKVLGWTQVAAYLPVQRLVKRRNMLDAVPRCARGSLKSEPRISAQEKGRWGGIRRPPPPCSGRDSGGMFFPSRECGGRRIVVATRSSKRGATAAHTESRARGPPDGKGVATCPRGR